MEMDVSLVAENEGEIVGGASSYISSFKKNKEIVNTHEIEVDTNPLPLPEKWEATTEKDILAHYIKRYKGLDKSKKIERIQNSLTRIFSVSISNKQLEEKIATYFSEEDLKEEKPQQKKEVVVEKVKEVKIEIAEKKYDFIKGLPELTKEQKELVMFLEKDICFSSNSYSFYLALKPGKEGNIENLFNFNEREKMMLDIFKEQIGDEFKAKKLVLLSRNFNNTEEKVKKGK